MNFWDQQGNDQYQQYGYTQGQTPAPNQQGTQPQQPTIQRSTNDQTSAPQQQIYGSVPYPYNSNQYTTMLSSLQQQTQQRQALGALAAASLSSLLNPSLSPSTTTTTVGHQQQFYYQAPSPPASQPVNSIYPDQRGVIPYDDIYGESTGNNKAPTVADESGGSCCLRYYKTKKALVQHQSQHVSCQECPNFTGVRQLLQDHMETFHGAAKKNKKSVPDGVAPANAPRLDTPEAIAKWIEQRKKNWPSRANVERKAQLEKEREDRGELPKNQSTNRKRKDQPMTTHTDKNSKKGRTELPSNSLVSYDSDSDQEYLSANEEFDNNNSKNKDDDTMDLKADAISSKDPTSMGQVAIPTTTTTERPRKLCKYNMRGKCRRGDECTYSHEKPANRNNQGKGKQRDIPAEEFRKRPHLLKMLLAKEIRQEQNVILQCLRYIKENEFFGLDQG